MKVRKLRALSIVASGFLLFGPQGFAADTVTTAEPSKPVVYIPRISSAPKLSDFEGLQPITPLAQSMSKVDQFVTREPVFGKLPTQATEVFLGYTDQNLYMVFLAHDTDPKRIRSHMSRREDVDDDDQIGFFFDTFADQQNAYLFYVNPKGIQQDGTVAQGQNFSLAWDGIWKDDAKVTDKGYMVLIEIPFKTLRFRSAGDNTWRFIFHRAASGANEQSYYPAFQRGRPYPPFQDMAELKGLEGVKPGKNIYLNPYFVGRAFRSIDNRDLSNLSFTGKAADPRVGLDAKAVIKNSLVLDATINPDFAQVESDEPQVTVNQRFETFFPEKRPFFIENSGYFVTPINLVFTRRIADPLYGGRATGKIGKWAIGALFANDRAPGKVVLDNDPLRDRSAKYGILRLNRELGGENTLGVLYTDRTLDSPPDTDCGRRFCSATVNRVGGVDGHFRFSPNTQTSFQVVKSRSAYNDGTSFSGHDAYGIIRRTTRTWDLATSYRDVSEGFETLTGFFERPDLRHWISTGTYTRYGDGHPFVAHGPSLRSELLWDQSGLMTGYLARLQYNFNFANQSNVNPFVELEHERLRPVDFGGLTTSRDYPHHRYGINWFKRGSVMRWNGGFSVGQKTNYASPDGIPRLSDAMDLEFNAIVRGGKGITVENTYLWSRIADQQTSRVAFNDHIFRQKWNLQFTREMSLRFITQYEATLANPTLAALPQRKNLNFDLLFTYLLNPGTALYVGYNSNMQNLDRALYYNSGDYGRSDKFLNDGRQIFVKLSYLFRF
ncbi:MAG TPA: DUF5916 domain-containing protein [Terriglobales bacterium]|nr:DUF5916 domain-containing protein [Terriglobales bacterium]